MYESGNHIPYIINWYKTSLPKWSVAVPHNHPDRATVNICMPPSFLELLIKDRSVCIICQKAFTQATGYDFGFENGQTFQIAPWSDLGETGLLYPNCECIELKTFPHTILKSEYWLIQVFMPTLFLDFCFKLSQNQGNASVWPGKTKQSHDASSPSSAG